MSTGYYDEDYRFDDSLSDIDAWEEEQVFQDREYEDEWEDDDEWVGDPDDDDEYVDDYFDDDFYFDYDRPY